MRSGRCEKCGLEFAIGADPALRKGGILSIRLWAWLHGIPAWLVFLLGVIVGAAVGFLLENRIT
jgi:ABC-type uncharacterized transport system permease subunit